MGTMIYSYPAFCENAEVLRGGGLLCTSYTEAWFYVRQMKKALNYFMDYWPTSKKIKRWSLFNFRMIPRRNGMVLLVLERHQFRSKFCKDADEGEA